MNKLSTQISKEEYEIDFISYISHELRTPISSMRWNAEILLDGTTGEMTTQQKEIIETIYNENKRLGGFIDSLLKIKYIDEGRYSLQNEEIHLALMIDSVLHNFENQIKNKKLKIEKDFPSNPALFNFDKKTIEIFLNALIGNAILYNKDDGIVKISFKYNDDLLIDITDTGIGIPESDQKKVGQEMFRGNLAKEKSAGTGISLLLISRILKLTGGEMSFKSKENEGSTFSLKLPRNKI